MAKFYVGQRVRKVKLCGSSGVCPEMPLGREGMIVRLYFAERGSETCDGGVLPADIDCEVDFDGDCRSCAFWQLEPIQPEGWKKISWEEMKDLWTPKELSHV